MEDESAAMLSVPPSGSTNNVGNPSSGSGNGFVRDRSLEHLGFRDSSYLDGNAMSTLLRNQSDQFMQDMRRVKRFRNVSSPVVRNRNFFISPWMMEGLSPRILMVSIVAASLT